MKRALCVWAVVCLGGTGCEKPSSLKSEEPDAAADRAAPPDLGPAVDAPISSGEDGGEDLLPGGCKADSDCTALLPATTPAGCATALCDVVAHACRFVARDADLDGHPAASCVAVDATLIEVGDDCDDGNAQVYPGAWDGPAGDGHSAACNGVDNDCNGSKDDGKLADGSFCHCVPGATRTCADDGKLGTCAAGSETCAADATWGACSVQPAAKDGCVPGNDDTCNGVPNEACPCVGRDTPADYLQPCGSCGGHVQCDESCSVPTPANLGASCNSCGGVVQCNGSCSTTQPANLGASCNSCGGIVQCSGACSTSQPGNLGAACGSCGGHVQCNGSCSVPTPGNLGAVCNSCGGVVQCNGTCSTTQPGNLGQSCNSCGGVVQCNGACSTSQPGNLNAPCGSCGGHVQCNGTCSVGTPPDLGNVINRSFDQEKFACCYIDYYKVFGGACDAGYNYNDYSIDKISGGGSCDIVSQGSGTDCSILVHFHNNGLEGAICNITVREKRVCN